MEDGANIDLPWVLKVIDANDCLYCWSQLTVAWIGGNNLPIATAACGIDFGANKRSR